MLSPHLPTQRVTLSDIHADPENARRHDERNLDAIKDSLRQFGQVEPLVVQKSTGKVIGGNGRLEAMQALKWTHCDIVRVDLADAKAAALGVALNRTAELAEWDAEALEKILGGIKDEIDLTTLGFDAMELEHLLEEEGDMVDVTEYEKLPTITPAEPRTPAPSSAPAQRPQAEDEDSRPVYQESPPAPAPAPAPTAQGVRTVQLFYAQEQAKEFFELADVAQEIFQAEHLSDTILEVLRRVVAATADA